MKYAVTGPDGFIAWHVRAALRARTGFDAIHIGRREFENPDLLDRALTEADAVIHLAGVNRAGTDSEIADTNRELAETLLTGLQRVGRPLPVVYGNSIHSDSDSVFGSAKRAAADILMRWTSTAPVVDVVLPNIFGENGRPFYNSVVATFCHQLTHNETPRIDVDREMPLLHAQAASDILIESAGRTEAHQLRPPGAPVTVTDLLTRLVEMRQAYLTAELPDLSDPFTRDLFNTYRSYTFPHEWPVHPPANSDDRGVLYETLRAHGGEAQAFFSSTRPGFTRGQHFHLRKVERFLVLRGRGVIRLRELFSDEIVEFTVSGERPAIVDMPTMWAHSITNIGDDELVTLFYADELLDPERPDTYPEAV